MLRTRCPSTARSCRPATPPATWTRWICRRAPIACARCAASGPPPRSSTNSSQTRAPRQSATTHPATRPTTRDDPSIDEEVPRRSRGELLLRCALAGVVGRRPLLTLRADLAICNQLADRQCEILGRRAQPLADLLDAQTRVGLDVRRKLVGQHLEICGSALGAAATARPARAGAAGQRD